MMSSECESPGDTQRGPESGQSSASPTETGSVKSSGSCANGSTIFSVSSTVRRQTLRINNNLSITGQSGLPP